MENTSLQDEIGWLVQTILASLLTVGKLADWISEVGLAHDLERLRSEIEGVKTVVSAVKEGATQISLAPLKDLLCNADLMLNELDCWGRQGGGEMDGHRAPQDDVDAALLASSIIGKLRFDIKNPPSSTVDDDAIPVATGGNSTSRKMKRVDESTHVTRADTNPWTKDEFSDRIQEITSQLQGVRGVFMILGSDPCQGTSNLVQRKLYGRSTEKRSIIKLINKHKSAPGVAVLPIVGIAGVGKTALAQHAFNDPSVGSQFDHKIWIPVSDKFDKTRPSKEMLAFVQHQEVLKGYIGSKRVLLVLDDVWDDMNDCQWSKLLASFSSDNAKGNFVLLTTRKPSIAKRKGTAGSIELDALEGDDILLLFKACAFGDDKYVVRPILAQLGLEIAEKLNGNPLAAVTAGTLLIDNCSLRHWRTILNKEAWKSLQHSGGIMPALKLSYDELTYPLQQCFSFCSIFPYGYPFIVEDLVHIWISLGFVKCTHSSQRLEEIGQSYLTDLVNLGFFQQVQKNSQTCYVLCGLMHDLAWVVSRTECATMDGLQCNEMLPTVRHLSIVTDSAYQSNDLSGHMPRSVEFEVALQKISARKLRTLVLIGQYDSFFFKAFQDVFQRAHNLRLLHMSATSSDFNSFLCGLVNHTHLRYVKLQDGYGEPELLPGGLSKFLRLQVLDVALLRSLHTVHLEDCGEWRTLPSLERLPFLTRLSLSNMRKIRKVSVPSLEELVLDGMPELQTCSCTSMGGLKSSLRVLEIKRCPALEVFDLFQKGHNYEIEQKPWLPSLRKLIICNCPCLQVQIPFPPSAVFDELLISGFLTLPRMCGSSSETLEIGVGFLSSESSHEVMALDDKILAFHNLRNIKYLGILSCKNLRYISFKGFSQLISLKSLNLKWCDELFSSDVVPDHTHGDMITATDAALPSLESLCITSCGITGKWLFLMLLHAPALKELSLEYCDQLTQLRIEEEPSIQLNLISASENSSSTYLDYTSTSSAADGLCRIPSNLTSSLKKIKIYECPNLIFVGSREGFAEFTFLEKLKIEQCPELLSSLVEANGRWLLPQSLEKLVIDEYPMETLQPYFVDNLTCLKNISILNTGCLESLQLHSCTAVEDLEIMDCKSLVALEGMPSLGTLRSLNLYNNSMLESLELHSCMSLEWLSIIQCSSLVALEGLKSLVNLRHLTVSDVVVSSSGPILPRSGASYQLIKRISCHRLNLESLHIDDIALLTTSFCKGLTCLRSLRLTYLRAARLTEEQERALLLHKSLQELLFVTCQDLVHLPSVLHSLHSLKTLQIKDCKGISRLPKEGLPPSLEELVIEGCSDELSEQCRSLATSKLTIKFLKEFDWDNQ